MRASAILREAFRGVVSGTSRALLTAVVLSAVVLPVQIADLTLTRSLVEEARSYRDSGASVQTVVAAGRIDGAACSALGALPSVRAAGAVRAAPHELVAAVLPRSPLPLLEVTGGFPEVVRASTRPSAGLVLSDGAVLALGLDRGEVALTEGGVAHVRGSYSWPDDGRRTGFGFAALAVSPPGAPFDECWVDVWPQSERIRALLLTTVQSAGGGPRDPSPVLAPLNSSRGDVFDGGTRYAGRITLLAPPLAGLLALAAGAAVAGLRRLELASALHSGVRRVELLAVLMLEAIAWLLPVAAVAAAVSAVFCATGPTIDEGPTLVQGLRTPACVLLGGLVGTAGAALAAREAHLLHYVKNR
ncbi:hypothetical protein NB037_12175 [Rathayibacter sp. ZW T2_19]|uniref:FtsX-like permease family protein n=1 Tax=Rathayibacter rubneri TaxID=2950106 RepID=A0A9X2DY21_9MICO|nr:hypothetical protein [Rathayibacter rubneri]MCM6763175.1 hypothetical protein [Rathayibacter rubneri]